MDNINRQVAEMVSGITDVSPSDVVGFLRMADEGRYVFHGIRSRADFEKVVREGVKPLSPEGGKASYWNTGYKLFGIPEGKRLLTNDSTLFNWGHFNDMEDTGMGIAISDYGGLKSSGLKPSDPFCPGEYVTVGETVAPSLCHMVQIIIPGGKRDREYAKEAERLMLGRLFSLLGGEYKPGSADRFSYGMRTVQAACSV